MCMIDCLEFLCAAAFFIRVMFFCEQFILFIDLFPIQSIFAKTQCFSRFLALGLYFFIF